MTLEETKDFLTIAQEISDRISLEQAHYESLFEDFTGINMGLCNALDGIIDTIDKHLGNNDWASWWAFECDFGNNPMDAGVDGSNFIVDSVDKLYELAMKEMNEC